MAFDVRRARWCMLARAEVHESRRRAGSRRCASRCHENVMHATIARSVAAMKGICRSNATTRGAGKGNRGGVGWQGGSCERHRPVVRCIIDPIERRGEMRARWDTRCAPIDTNSRNSFDGTGLRRIADRGGMFAASVLSRANDAIRNRTTPAIVSQDAVAASTSAASVGGSRKHTRYPRRITTRPRTQIGMQPPRQFCPLRQAH